MPASPSPFKKGKQILPYTKITGANRHSLMKRKFTDRVITRGGSITKVILTATFIGVFSCKTNKPMHSYPNRSTTRKDSLITDNDGNKHHVKILLDGKLWMTHNLNSNISNSYCYDDINKNCRGYGRLYTWESANEGCKLLGEGWRLPSNSEWQQLSIVYGGDLSDSAAIRRKAYFT